MSEQKVQTIQEPELWATVELMGHGQTAGMVAKPTEWGGLLRVDVPIEDGEYRTEFYGLQSIYSIKFVSEEIARAFIMPHREINCYDTPIVTRDQHESVVRRLEMEQSNLRREVRELQHRLTAVNALPEPEPAYSESELPPVPESPPLMDG